MGWDISDGIYSILRDYECTVYCNSEGLVTEIKCKGKVKDYDFAQLAKHIENESDSEILNSHYSDGETIISIL